MSAPMPTICVVEPRRDTNLSDVSDSTLLLRLAAKRFGELCGFDREDAAVAEGVIENRLLDEDPVIVLAPMPRSLSLGEKIQDFIFANPHLTFLLGHPACFVVFVTGFSREYLDAELAAWSKRAGRAFTPPEHLASSTPLFWSFVTLAELTVDVAPDGMREVLAQCANTSLFDPTGFRSFLLALLKDAAWNVASGTATSVRAPLFAVVADDEEDVAIAHGYHLRRLGYSTLLVHDVDMWKQIVPGGAWAMRSGRPDVLMFDDVMDFQPGIPRIGHALLDKLSADVKIYITGLASSAGSDRRPNIVGKPVIDAHDLWRKLPSSNAARLVDQFVDVRGTSEAIHLAPASILRRTARHVVAGASRIDERNNRKLEASLHYLEAYRLLVGVDESAAANAFVRFELLEVTVVAGRHPDALEAQFWPDREREISRVLATMFRVHQEEGLWWAARVFQEIEVIMDASLVAADLLLQVDASTNRAVMRLLWHKERRRRASGALRYVFWLRWLNPLLWMKWALRASFALFNSFGSVFMTWVTCNLAFAAVYASLGGRCNSWRGVWLLWPARAVIASFGAGTGLAFPQDYGLCLPADGHLWLGSLQRVLTLVFLAKILDLFVTRTRTRA